MQGKGIIQFFLIALLATCAWYGLQVYPTYNQEKKAVEFADSKTQSLDKNDVTYPVAHQRFEAQYLDSIGNEDVFLGRTYNELKGEQIALGLDLKGGMSAVLQVDVKDLLIELANDSKDASFRAALEQADKDLTQVQDKYVTLFGNAYAAASGDKKLAPIFVKHSTLKEKINISSTNAEVITTLQDVADETVKLTFERLKKRIDKFGVTQPNISLDAERDLILIELPGVQNPERAREFLQTSAKLEFWETYRLSDNNLFQSLVAADNLLKDKTADTEEKTYEYNEVRDSLGNVVSIDTVEVSKAAEQKAGPLFSLLQPVGGSIIGVAQEKNKDKISALLARPEVAKIFPKDLVWSWGYKSEKDPKTNNPTGTFALYGIKKASKKAPLDGEHVTNAQENVDQMNGTYIVSIDMDSEGARKWAKLTDKAFKGPKSEENREIAIVLDEEVISAPTVQAKITGGSSQISGNFDAADASDLATYLNVGKLPAKLSIIQESLIGPTLGQDNINKSVISMAVGFLLVLIFMFLYYGTAGFVALVTSILNLILIYGCLSAFNVVLTLPGIAGIVLTIGMAVDANVIIYERIKEELRKGNGLLPAITDGFKYSYSAIIDANITTLITAVILFMFGLGPIKGFAVILMIGIFTSFFTAVLVGRMFIEGKARKGKDVTFWTSASKNVLTNLNYDFLGKRKIGYIVSSVIILAGIASMATKGFDLGIDFKGGYTIKTEFAESVKRADIQDALAQSLGSAPIVKTVQGSNTFDITTDYLIDQKDADKQVVQKVVEGLNTILTTKVKYEDFVNTSFSGTKAISTSKVGPTIADDIKRSSIISTVLALVFIFGYILFRFRKWQFSLGAVAALFHDVLLVLGLFSIFHGILPFSLEIDQAFIAAILTVVGYSINDTVVVFDRIREYMNVLQKKSDKDVVNQAVNHTVSRTIITSLTTLFVVLVLFIFGGGSIKGFAFALLIGILVGTYSSIFVATPIFFDLSKKQLKEEE